MPLYTFQRGKIIKDFFFSMEEVVSIGEEVEIEGKKWKRVILEAPGATVDSINNIDPSDSQKFIEKTGKMSGTVGDIWDESARLSELREKKYGKDKIKDSYIKEKEKERESKRAKNRVIKEKQIKTK